MFGKLALKVRKKPLSEEEWGNLEIDGNTYASVKLIDSETMERMPSASSTFADKGIISFILKKTRNLISSNEI